MGRNDFRYAVTQKRVFEYQDGKITSRYRTFICIHLNGVKIPHPITNFIRQRYENKSSELNTVKKYAEITKQFLNFICESSDLEYEEVKMNGLKKLKVIHGIKYFNYLSYKERNGLIRPNTAYIQIRIISELYSWLVQQEIMDKEEFPHNKEIVSYMGRKFEKYITPFNKYNFDMELPKKESKSKIRSRKLHDFGQGRLDLINLFLRIAEIEEPDIAFGIALQFYGGLRRGEVVNLLTTSLKNVKVSSTTPLLVTIADNWSEIFSEKSVLGDEQVKNPREQIILNVDIVNRLMELHLKRLNTLKKQHFIKNNVLFLSSKSKKPISGKAYSKKFNNIREKFLHQVLKDSVEDYYFLISRPWSTHIGRGIFTNILIFKLGWNESEVASARGDNSILSSMLYIEEMNLKRLSIEAIEQLSKDE